MNCPITIDQLTIDEIITETLTQLLDNRYITIKSFDKVFNFDH